MVRARPGNPTLRDSLDLAGQPGKSSGWHGLLHRSHHGGGAGEGRGVACGAGKGLPNCLSALTQSFHVPLAKNIFLDNSRIWDKGTEFPLGHRQISFH